MAARQSGDVSQPVSRRVSRAERLLAYRRTCLLETIRPPCSQEVAAADHPPDDYSAATGPRAARARELGIGATVISPIVVEGATWEVIAVFSRKREPLPADTEARLSEFGRHAAMALANAKSPRSAHACS
jgi:hypothetical protein